MSAERGDLRLHCYRMLGSLLDSEVLADETVDRARSAGTADTSPAALYRLATIACLDALAKRPPRVLPHDVVPASDPAGPPPAMTEHAWLEPYPDHLLNGTVGEPMLDLAFLAAIQHLPPKQRATLILRDVLGWSANDTAGLLEISVPATKSALQRARGTLNERLPGQRAQPAGGQDHAAVLERYIAAREASSADALADLLAEDVRASYPPLAMWADGRDDVVRASNAYRSPGELRGLATMANTQPAAALYLRSATHPNHDLIALAVLRISDGKIAEIVEFGSPDVLAALGLPATL
jgi:RNA polymerase sigma-70 factor, ECF subfamily